MGCGANRSETHPELIAGQNLSLDSRQTPWAQLFWSPPLTGRTDCGPLRYCFFIPEEVPVATNKFASLACLVLLVALTGRAAEGQEKGIHRFTGQPADGD